MIESLHVFGMNRRGLNDSVWEEFRNHIIRGPQSGVVLATCERALLISAQHDPILVKNKRIQSEYSSNAAHQVLRIAAGLDSRIQGETAILGQIRDAWAQSNPTVLANPIIRALGIRAVRAGRLARSVPGYGMIDLGYATQASRVVRQFTNPHGPQGRVVAVVGTGSTAVAFAKCMAQHGVRVEAFSRHPDKIDDARRRRFHALRPLESLTGRLSCFDAVISATRSNTPVIHLHEIEPRLRPLLVIDLGMPSTVVGEVSAANRGTLTVMRLDDLVGHRIIENRAIADVQAICENQLRLLQRDLAARAQHGRSELFGSRHAS